MEEARNAVHCATEAIIDGLREIGDFSYAVMPKDIAHSLGDFKKAVLKNLRSAIDWEISWIDERVAGGDKLRDEWREKCKQDARPEPPPSPVA